MAESTPSSPIEVLDQHLATYLDLLDRYTEQYAHLEQLLKKAFLDLAKAKVALGPARVGPDSYDLTPRPPIKKILILDPSPTHSSDPIGSSENGMEGPFLICSNSHELATDSPSSEPEVSPLQTLRLAPGTSLRKRRTVVSPESPSHVPDPQFESTNTDKSSVSPSDDNIAPCELPDPIHQFAVLPPPSLKAAQAGFSNTLESAVRLLNQKAKLLELETIIEHHKRVVNLASTPSGIENVGCT